MNYILVTFLRSLLQDIPILLTGFICLYLVFTIYLPKDKKARKWISLILIEITEHIILPISLIIILLLFNNWIAGFLFNLVILLFIFVFLGYFVIKARARESWKDVCLISLHVYFFVFCFPLFVIESQIYFSINGYWIMGIMMFIYLLFFLYKLFSKKDYPNYPKNK